MNKNRLFKDKLVTIIAYCFIGLFAIICLYPLILTISVSFSSEQEIAKNGYSIIPLDFTFDTYKYIFINSGSKILRSYGVTIFNRSRYIRGYADYQYDCICHFYKKIKIS